MGAAADLKNARMNVAPVFDVLQVIEGWHREFLGELDLLRFIIYLEEALRYDGRRGEDSCELSAQQVALFTGEWRVAMERGVEVTREEMFDCARSHDMLWSRIWQLDPVIQRVISDPVNELVNAFTSLLDFFVIRKFFASEHLAACNPVVLLSAKNFAAESHALSSAHDCKSLKMLVTRRSLP